MECIASNRPRQGEFFILEPDALRGGKGHGVVFENEQKLLTPPRCILQPEEGGFPALCEIPRLTHYAGKGAFPQDLEGGMSGYWLVSQRLRNVMEAPEAEFVFLVEGDIGDPAGRRASMRTRQAVETPVEEAMQQLEAQNQEQQQLQAQQMEQQAQGQQAQLEANARVMTLDGDGGGGGGE